MVRPTAIRFKHNINAKLLIGSRIQFRNQPSLLDSIFPPKHSTSHLTIQTNISTTSQKKSQITDTLVQPE